MKEGRLGVFGGTFDPVHRGHFQLAEHAKKEVGLDRVLFIPAAQPPHKYRVFTSFRHRLRMLELHCAGHKDLYFSDIEETLPKPSYTVDTLAALRQIYEEAELYFILGTDAFLDLMTWKAYPDILSQVQFVISPRVGYRDQKLQEYLHSLGYQEDDTTWRCDDKKDIILLSGIPLDVSSQEIRTLIGQGAEVDRFLHPAVLKYIRENGLYCSPKLDVAFRE